MNFFQVGIKLEQGSLEHYSTFACKYVSTNGEIQSIVQLSWLSLKDEWFKLKTLDKLPIMFEKPIEHSSYPWNIPTKER